MRLKKKRTYYYLVFHMRRVKLREFGFIHPTDEHTVPSTR